MSGCECVSLNVECVHVCGSVESVPTNVEMCVANTKGLSRSL